MKKSILKLGKALNKAEQKEVNGGAVIVECGDSSGGCSCNCFFDDRGLCVMDISVFTTPCD